jgi:hypothetical protein
MYKSLQFSISGRYPKSLFYNMLISSLVLLIILSANSGMSQGNLLIMPGRVVFEGAKKSQELTLANTGNDTAKYVVSFIQMRMKEDGSFEQITTPDSGQFFSNKFFRIFPRTVTLPPNQSQVVKMQLTKPAKMATGEYRSHLYFRAVPKSAPLGEDASQRDSTALSVKLTPVFGITIPAIIRVGECSAKVTISDVSVEIINDTVPRLQMTFTRSGNISVFGDITVNHIAPDGKITRVALVKGLAVYTPNLIRKFQYNINKTPGIDFHKGKLRIVYSSPDDVKASKLAEAELILR